MSESKPTIRSQARTRRADLARALPDFAQRIAAFTGQLNIPANAIVAGYWPLRDEADPRALMKALGTPLALPRIDAKHAALSLRAWREGDALADNQHGIAEPRADAKIVMPDVLLVPLLAFNASGHRLGYGGGYYDRTIEHLRARGKILTIGVAYAGQEVGELAREPHDRPLDFLVTERGVQTFPLYSLRRLDAHQKDIVRRALQIAAESSLFPEWEFHTIFGVQRFEVASIAACWPPANERDEGVLRAIGNTLNNLLGYPHDWQKDWDSRIEFSREELQAIQRAWIGDVRFTTRRE